MPALFAAAGTDDALTPLAQLGAGPEGAAVLARRGEKLVIVHTPSFAPDSPRWVKLEARVRAIGAVVHPSIRAVLGIDREPQAIMLEGDSFPPLAESIEQGGDPARGIALVLDLARALAAAHRLGIFHGGIHPWSVWVGPNQKPRFELTQLATRSHGHAWTTRCAAPETATLPLAGAIIVSTPNGKGPLLSRE